MIRGALTFAICSVVAGCSSSSTSPPADPFVGTWSCTTSSTTTFTQPPNTPPASSSGNETVVISDDGSGNLTAALTSDADAGVPSCALKSTLNADGKSTSLVAGQTCATVNGGTLAYTSGSSTLNANGTRSTTSAWNFTGKTTAGVALVGVGAGSGQCTKK